MLLPDFAIDALLEGRRPELRTYETTFSGPGSYDPGQTFTQSNALNNIDVENKPPLEWGGYLRDQKTTENDQAGQMAADVKLPPLSSSEPNTTNPINSGNDINEIMDRAITAALESMETRKTIISRRKGSEVGLSLDTARKRDQTCVETPSLRNSNPFDDPSYQWKGPEDTPALVEYLENKFEVRIRSSSGGPVTFTRKIASNQTLDKPSMDVDSPLIPESEQAQFGHESWSPRDGNMVQNSPHVRRQLDLIPSHHQSSESPQLPNATPTTPQNGPDDLVDTLFSPTEFNGKRGFTCTYECPISEEMCAAFLNGNDKQNRYRHAAMHAEDEEELVASGIIDLEDALVFTQLPKVVVKCDIEG